MLLMFVVFMVFFIVIPQQKRKKQEKLFFNELKPGSKVITTGGLHGKVLNINDDGTVIIETGAGKMKFDKAAISVEKSNAANKPSK